MAREKENYREQLAMIREEFPGKQMLTVADIARWLHKDPRTVKRMFSVDTKKGISIVQLASEMLP